MPPPHKGISALLIFLNKTCFNGLFRVSARGAFNVPFGRYARPKICDEENLRACSSLLQRCEILCGDFAETLSHVPAPEKAVFYLDPPYKPISRTASFTAYVREKFDDAEQVRLRDFCRGLDAAGTRWILSNSAPADGFFETLYEGFRMRRVSVARAIASDAARRGNVSEFLISNF